MRKEFFLENEIYCKGTTHNFHLYYTNIKLTPALDDIIYIPKTLISVMSEKNILVYKPKIVLVDNVPTLYEIARFKPLSPNAYLKVILNNKAYIINSNMQITLCDLCSKT